MSEFNGYALNTNIGTMLNKVQTIEQSTVDGILTQFVFSNVYTPAVVYNDDFFVMETESVVFNIKKTAGFELKQDGSIIFWKLA